MADSTNSIDFTTIAAVKDRAEIQQSNSNADQEIQDAITAFSQHLINQFGGMSFNGVKAFTETRDGNGNSRIFVRFPPIHGNVSVSVCGVSVPQAGAYPTFGFYVADDKKSIIIRGTNGSGGRGFTSGVYRSARKFMGFPPGTGNVSLSYSGGYAAVPNDLEYAVRCIVAINYKRKGTQDMGSKTTSIQGGASTTTFRNWVWPPEYDRILDIYSRLAVVE